MEIKTLFTLNLSAINFDKSLVDKDCSSPAIKRPILLFSIILTLAVASTQIFAQTAFSAQGDYYLKLDGIKGSVSTEGREGWILLDAVKYGESDLDNLIKSVRTINRDIKQLDTL